MAPRFRRPRLLSVPTFGLLLWLMCGTAAELSFEAWQVSRAYQAARARTIQQLTAYSMANAVRLASRGEERVFQGDSLVVVTVRDGGGRIRFTSDSTFDSGSAIATQSTRVDDARVDAARGDGAREPLVVTVSLRPEALPRLGLDAAPQSNLYAWLGLLVVTGTLAWILLFRMREEHEVARVQSHFVASISHELRTPLSQILLYGETLTMNRARSDTHRQAAAEVIVRETRRLMRLVENALHFARTKRQSLAVLPERARLDDEIRDVLATFAPIAASAQNDIVNELEPGLVVMLDRSAFRQILLNLLDNAVKYGPRGQQVDVRLRRVVESARVEVRDRGPGVSPAEADDIWEPFVRGRRGTESGGETGSGIGLAVVRDLMARHGGRVWVEQRTDGPGAQFVLEFPLASIPDHAEHGGEPIDATDEHEAASVPSAETLR